MAKHVIFLGAGASHASGYPLANKLRLLLSSQRHFSEWILECFPGDGNAVSLASECFRQCESSIKLFREGGFATVDEFCKLNSDKITSLEIQHMRYLTRVVLAALNPEEKFEKSEYYSFVQKLYDTNLTDLREDITVLSFNYDPYLEYLLFRAWAIRNGKLPSVDLCNSMTSGFYEPDNCEWADLGQPNFYLLKLHGSICEIRQKQINAHLLFTSPSKERKEVVFDVKRDHTPPIVFPWEVFDENLAFREEDFPVRNSPNNLILFKRIWERAAKEILSADKISFIGLSMHPYLELGFRYLFEGKAGIVQVVVANILNEHFRDEHRTKNPLHPNSPCRKVYDLLMKVTDRKLATNYSDCEPVTIGNLPDNAEQKITARYSFADFIEHEM